MKFKKANLKPGSQKASVFAFVQEIKPQTKRQNRGRKVGHLKRGGEICMQNALEKVNDKHHYDDFAEFILELVERVHLEDFALFGLLELLDLGDKQLVNAEAKDVKHERHEVEVDRAHDLADDVGVEILGVKIAEKVVINGDENLAHVVAGDDEKHDRAEQAKDHRQEREVVAKEQDFFKSFTH